MKVNLIRNVLALWVVIYSLIVFTAFFLEIFENEDPCPLCYLQRIAMLLICSTAVMSLIFGIRPHFYALAILSALFGGSVAVRQILLHICPSFSQFGIPFWGYSLFTWSFITFFCSLLLTGTLLLFYDETQKKKQNLNFFQSFAVICLVLVIVGNIISVTRECGMTFCQ